MIIKQNRAEDGALGFKVRRQTSYGGFESSHDVELSALHRNLFLPVEVCGAPEENQSENNFLRWLNCVFPLDGMQFSMAWGEQKANIHCDAEK
jgi:hypothetical protein